MDYRKQIALLYCPFDKWGNHGAGQGVIDIYKRMNHYLHLSDERLNVYQFFNYLDYLSSFLFNLSETTILSKWEEIVQNKIREIVSTGEKFIFLGGAHNSLVPVLKTYELMSDSTLLVMLDSHVDVSYKTLAGKGYESELKDIDNFLSPFIKQKSNMEIIHIGSKHPLQAVNNKIKNIKLFTWQDVIFKGEELIFGEIDRLVNEKMYSRIHIDIDVDSISGPKMLAVLDPASLGLSLDFILKLVALLVRKESFTGISLEGYNPIKSKSELYLEVCLRLIENFVYLIQEHSMPLSFSQKHKPA